jgi:hypothetical protein
MEKDGLGLQLTEGGLKCYLAVCNYRIETVEKLELIGHLHSPSAAAAELYKFSRKEKRNK